jgi:hypothetical protein
MLARYDLEHELGTGARGAVCCGRHSTTGRKVAIKLVTDSSPREACGEEEALALRAHPWIDHPDIVHGDVKPSSTVYDPVTDRMTASSAA